LLQFAMGAALSRARARARRTTHPERTPCTVRLGAPIATHPPPVARPPIPCPACYPACRPLNVPAPPAPLLTRGAGAGMNKMIVNHLNKLFVTNDASTMVREMEVAHPAAKLVAMAAQAQTEEIGDATNLVVVLAGTLCEMAEDLLRQGLHTADIIAGSPPPLLLPLTVSLLYTPPSPCLRPTW